MAVDILELLCAVLLVGGGLALLFKRLGLPVIPGYILGGFLLSPKWPYVPVSFPSDSPQVRTLSNLGVLLLLFTVGLEFGFKRIRALGLRPFAVGTAECVACGLLA
jgi:monovalent cation:H+ antiporter-2, CPA2 family